MIDRQTIQEGPTRRISERDRRMPEMRVLQIITHLAVGGATETMLTTCRLGNASGHPMEVLCGQISTKEQSLFKQCEQNGIRVNVLPSLGRAIQPSSDLRAYRDLIRWLSQNPYDVVHTNGSKAGILGRLAAARAGIPVITHTVFGWGYHDYMKAAMRNMIILLERRAARVSSRIIAVSDANRRKGLADGIGRPEQYSVIYNAIDIPRYRDVDVDACALRRQLGIPLDAPVVGTVSRLARQKAPKDFLRVAQAVQARCPAAKFVFIGGGPLQSEFLSECRRMGLEKTVVFLNYRQDVPELLRVFDVFLLTSLWEGLPTVCPQAMCAGLPIVATSVDGTPETVWEGETGFLLPPHDCAGMAARVLELLDNPEMRYEMGQKGLERVYPAFCDQEMGRRICALYEECGAGRRDESVVKVK